MKKVITFRQLFYMFLACSVTPILTLLPAELAVGNSRSACISVLLSLVALVPLALLITLFMQAYPHHNFYEILVELMGRAVAKIIMVFYGAWAMVSLATKVWQYALNLQSSIMSNTKEQVFFIAIIILVVYAFLHGVKTIFRFAEFILVPILLIIVIYVLSAVPNIRFDYIKVANPLSFSQLWQQAGFVIAAAGNILLILMYGDSVKDYSKSKKLICRFFVTTIVLFCVLLIVVTVISFGLVGNNAAASMATPFYVAMKGISVMNIVENFEAILIMIMFLSDFLGICLYASISMRCVKWVCSVRNIKFLYVPFAAFIYFLALTLCRTQFDVEFLYNIIIVKWNLVMLYAIPFLLIIVHYGKKLITSMKAQRISAR
ncbi:GerAB/ArcD/ProY family transporter [Anaerosporobacter sp.]|uniref:GerAB/ArcD/ProY family transporter n=1 Tax=Anaerosporobacter sp. TaxID=1872529 RepID=UPI00286F4E4F|nr:GerAB/ArcD/ProY family transporter [Anaerosporobacter sp.]